jgi:hypothetical protein
MFKAIDKKDITDNQVWLFRNLHGVCTDLFVGNLNDLLSMFTITAAEVDTLLKFGAIIHLNWIAETFNWKVGDFVLHDNNEWLISSIYMDTTPNRCTVLLTHRDSITSVEVSLQEFVAAYEVGIIRVIEDKPKNTGCSCGAKHTSNPSFHLSYCNLSKDKSNGQCN